MYAYEIERQAKLNLNTPREPHGVPTSFTGYLARSISTNKTADGYAVVASAPYAAGVEYGTFPHKVPIEALKKWARIKLHNEGLAYPIQKKIAKKGTRAQPYMEPAMWGAFEGAYNAAIRKVFL